MRGSIVLAAALACLTGAGLGAGARAQEAFKQTPKLAFGLGVAFKPDYEGSDEYEVLPLPSFEWRTEKFGLKTSGLGLEADFLPSPLFAAGPLVRYRGGRDSDVEDAAVSAVGDVDDAIEVGGYVAATAPVRLFGMDDPAAVTARLAFGQDIADGHGGFVIDAAIGLFRPLTDKLSGALSLATSLASDDYMERFFGVSAGGAARSGLAPFAADGGFKDVGVTAVLSYDVTDHWSVGVIANYTRLVGDAGDSPVTDDAGSPDQFFGGLTIGYRAY